MKVVLTISLLFLFFSAQSQYNVTSDLQVTNMGHFKGWQTNSLSGLGLDIGISSNMGYVMAYDRSNSQYHKLRLTASGGISGLTLDTNGNVGINNTSPVARLTVDGGDLQVSNMGHFKGWETNNLSGLGLDIGISSNMGYVMAYDRTNNQYHKLRLTASGGNNGLTLDTNSNVGIGTTSPNKTLHVSGGWKNQIQFQQSSGTANYAQLSSGTAWVGLFTGGTSEKTMMRAYHDGSKVVFENGNVGIGTDDPQSKLAVNGQIRATEMKVLADISVPDYVFEPDYELRTLRETKEYIAENKHLPEIPSASEIGENGINLGDMNMRLLKKIEELTLYQIELLERLEKAEEKIQQLENK